MKQSKFMKILALVAGAMVCPSKEGVEETMKEKNISLKDVDSLYSFIKEHRSEIMKKEGFVSIFGFAAFENAFENFRKILEGAEIKGSISEEVMAKACSKFTEFFEPYFEKESEEFDNIVEALKKLAEEEVSEKELSVEEVADICAKKYVEYINKLGECLVPNGLTERVLKFGDFEVKEENYLHAPVDYIVKK